MRGAALLADLLGALNPGKVVAHGSTVHHIV
jgi:hypothetical protein